MIEKCFECDFDGELEDHHVIPESLGGRKTVKLCLDCHKKVHDSNFRRKDGHSFLIKNGIAKARANGIIFGRPEGTGLDEKEFLSKYSDVVEQLQSGKSIRKTARLVGRGISTVQRVLKTLKNNN